MRKKRQKNSKIEKTKANDESGGYILSQLMIMINSEFQTLHIDTKTDEIWFSF